MNYAGVTNPWWYKVRGGIATYYNSHGASKKFGLATSAEFKLRDGGVSQRFAKNYDIYWTPSNGGHAVWWGGSIGAKFSAGGKENGYGFPTNDEHSVLNGGAVQTFHKANGKTYHIYWSAATGAHVIAANGAVGGAFAKSGYEAGWGFPTNEEHSISGGAVQTFRQANGQVRHAYWSAATGAHTVFAQGAIGTRFAQTGYEKSLGFPVTEETAVGNGVQQIFRRADGRRNIVLWSGSTGAHSMVYGGGIYNTFQAKGGVQKLGFPTTDEYTDGSGVVHQKFQKGEITWTAAGGTKVIYSK